MQSNQQQTKKHHPAVATMLALLDAVNTPELVGEPLRSIDGTLRQTSTAAETKAVELFTPAQCQALKTAQDAAVEIVKLVDLINTENVVWKLGLKKITAYEASDLLSDIDAKVFALHAAAIARGVNPVADNCAGASHFRAMRDRYQTLAAIQEKTNAFYKSRQLQDA